MATQVYFRSYNPVWDFRSLTGQPLDDTYYAFFLENTIPYTVQQVFHTPTGTPWSNPIQLTAAGTLPVDVYFQKDKVYRIEIRAGNTQSSALVWLIENYTPAEGSGGNVTTASLTSDNQITNPQFSLISFETSLAITNAGTYEVAPGWDLVLTGTGTATVTREALNNTSTNPTNAPYALRMAITGWTNRYLRQRFNQNGMLWAGKYVSTSLTAKVDSTPATISAKLVSSDGTDLAIVLNETTLTGVYDEYTFVTPTVLNASTNPDTPPDASIEYRLLLPASIDIYLSSVQVVSSSANLSYSYEQDTIERQIDHTFHFYKDSLLMQPKASILTGWDFGLNPWQVSNPAVSNVATNEYRGDQTIVLQQEFVANANGNNVSVSRGTLALNYGYTVQAVTNTNQFGILQYIAPQTCRPYWGSRLSCLIKLNARKQSGSNLRVKARLLHQSGLPSTTAQTVPIASWTLGQDPTAYSAGVTAIAPKNDPAYNLSNGNHTLTFDDFDLSGVPSDDSNMTMGLLIYTIDNMVESGTPDNITFQSVSLVPNDFAIECNALSFDETLRRCRYYYESSYNIGTLIGATESSNSLLRSMIISPEATSTSVTVRNLHPKSFGFEFITKRITNPTVTLRTPGAPGSANNVFGIIYNSGALIQSGNIATSNWTQDSLGDTRVQYRATTVSALLSSGAVTGNYADAFIEFHYTIDARLGV